MNPERWREIEKIFHRAVRCPAGAREALLARACDGHPALRREVEKLIAADRKAQRYMERPALADHPAVAASIFLEARDGPRSCPAGVPPTQLPGARLGPYRLLEALGEGGMGTVYLAEQIEPISRRVAVKLIRPDPPGGREAVLRFLGERQALARMNHPNIARVLEAGATELARPYLVMEYVPGLPITRYCDRHRSSLRRRLDLFIKVCEGVQHLHQKAVIHRDLKPSNILVTEEEGEPVPKIIDFGIAKALDRPLTEETLKTGDRLLGTPSYLCPEAIRAAESRGDLDTRADVYALGVVLYELLAGVLPFGRPGQSCRKVLRQIVEQEAPKPSARLRAMDGPARDERAARRGAEAAALLRHLRGDLDRITLKAIAKERSLRYASAAELAVDVARYLRHEPIQAGPPSTLYRFRKFVYRHRAAVVAAVVVAWSLMAGIALRTIEARRASREAQRANQEAARASHEAEAAKQVADFLVDMFRLSDPEIGLGDTVSARKLLDRGAEMVGRDLERQPLVRARLLDTIGVVYFQLALFEEARPLLEEALEIRRDLLGDEHLDVAGTLHHLADLHSARDRFAQAESFYHRALAITKKLLGPDRPEVAACLYKLADLYREQGEYARAEPLYRQALDLRIRALGAEDREVASGLAGLATLYSRQGRYAEAEAAYQRALAIRKEVFAPDHPEVASSFYNLAVNHSNQGQYGEAEPLFWRALEIQEKTLGPDHPFVASTLHSLASLYKNRGEYAAAEPFEQRALAIREQVFGPEHSQVALSCNNLGDLYKKLGRFEAARRLLSRAGKIWEKALGSEHPLVAASLNNLAELHLEQGGFAEAEPLFQRSAGILETTLGPEHPFIGHPLAGLARVCWQRGESARAATLFERALAIWRATEGYGHPDVEDAERSYSVLLQELGRAAPEAGPESRARDAIESRRGGAPGA